QQRCSPAYSRGSAGTISGWAILAHRPWSREGQSVESRQAPQRGFAWVIWSTSVRMAAVVLGRPGRVRVERWAQRRAEPLAMPTHDRVGLHDDRGRSLPRLGEEDPKQSIASAEVRTRDVAPEHPQLLTQRHLFERDGPRPATEPPERPARNDEAGN